MRNFADICGTMKGDDMTKPKNHAAKMDKLAKTLGNRGATAPVYDPHGPDLAKEPAPVFTRPGLWVNLDRLDPKAVQIIQEAAAAGEPVFVLRSQDESAPQIIQWWAAEALKRGTPVERIAQALYQAEVMAEWAKRHGSRVAGTR